MLVEHMEVGNFIDIIVERREYKLRLRSKVELVEKGRFYINPIMSSMRTFQFQPTDDITVIYHAEQSMWIWEKLEVQTVLVHDQYMHMFCTKKEGRNYNRRNAYRVPINEEYIFRHHVPLSEEELLQQKKEKKEDAKLAKQVHHVLDEEEGFRIYAFDGLMKNLSETGVAFFANRDLVVGDIVSFEVPTANGPISCKVEVVRIENERTTMYHRLFGCRLLQSSRGLAKYLYELQRTKLKKSRTLQ